MQAELIKWLPVKSQYLLSHYASVFFFNVRLTGAAEPQSVQVAYDYEAF